MKSSNNSWKGLRDVKRAKAAAKGVTITTKYPSAAATATARAHFPPLATPYLPLPLLNRFTLLPETSFPCTPCHTSHTPLISAAQKGHPQREAWPLTTATKNALAKNREEKKNRGIKEKCETKQKTTKQKQKKRKLTLEMQQDDDAGDKDERESQRRKEPFRSKGEKGRGNGCQSRKTRRA